MAVYNTDFYLVKRAIDSVLNQAYQHFELIIMDDGSTNDPANRLLDYAMRHENKIIYIRHKNCGQAESINRGVLISKGNFITIIDADDEYKSNHLSTCLRAIENYDLIASNTETVVDEETDFYVPDRNNHALLVHVDECILFATLFGKREVFTGIKFERKYAADAHFYEEAAKYFRVKKVDERTYVYYRNSPNSICSKIKSVLLSSAN
jgi:glycosyltransferase involved in cell wall biosynthesis